MFDQFWRLVAPWRATAIQVEGMTFPHFDQAAPTVLTPDGWALIVKADENGSIVIDNG